MLHSRSIGVLLPTKKKYNSKLDELNDKLAEKGDVLVFFN